MNILTLCLALLFKTAALVELKVTHKVYFDIAIDGHYFGTIVIGLFGSTVPHTVKNFLTISTKGIKEKTYAGTRFHRIIPRTLIQGGDIVENDGSGSISIYGKYFPNENFLINYTAPGFVGMANFGKDKNGCQFFITTRELEELNGRYVIFGKILEGEELIYKIQHMKSNYDDTPVKPIAIIDSGQLTVAEPFYIPDNPYTYWRYIKAFVPPTLFALAILSTFHWIIRRLDRFCT